MLIEIALTVDEVRAIHRTLDRELGDIDIIHAEDRSPEFTAFRKVDEIIQRMREQL